MKTLKTIFYLCFIIISITACSDKDDDGGYKGKNELFVTAESVNVIEDSEEGSLTLNIMLTKALDKDIELKFSLKNNEYNGVDITSLSENPVRIKAGDKTAKVTLKSNNKGILTNERVIEVDLASSTDTNVTLNKVLLITIKPGVGSVLLSDEQLKLIETYKKNGLDITKWIGLIPVKAKIIYPGGDYYAPFLDKYEKTIEGRTAITLSPNATAEKPILKMTRNAMGIEGYLYDILKAITIQNKEFWTNQPMPQQTIKLTGLSEDKAETFNLALDNLILDKASSTISFVSDNVMDIWGEKFTAVDFEYTYSAWDRLKKLIDEGNQDAIDANKSGGTIYPGFLLNLTDISSNGWGGDAWVKPSSSFNTTTGEMKFIFNLDHADGANYIRFEITYSPIK